MRDKTCSACAKARVVLHVRTARPGRVASRTRRRIVRFTRSIRAATGHADNCQDYRNHYNNKTSNSGGIVVWFGCRRLRTTGFRSEFLGCCLGSRPRFEIAWLKRSPAFWTNLRQQRRTVSTVGTRGEVQDLSPIIRLSSQQSRSHENSHRAVELSTGANQGRSTAPSELRKQATAARGVQRITSMQHHRKSQRFRRSANRERIGRCKHNCFAHASAGVFGRPEVNNRLAN